MSLKIKEDELHGQVERIVHSIRIAGRVKLIAQDDKSRVLQLANEISKQYEEQELLSKSFMASLFWLHFSLINNARHADNSKELKEFASDIYHIISITCGLLPKEPNRPFQ